MLLTLGLSWAAQAQFSGGSGSESNPYLISSSSDWTSLASAVNSGTNYSGKYFRLTTNITISGSTQNSMVGTMSGEASSGNAFSGNFNGDGHTITISYSTYSDFYYTAPFRYISNATIKNVKVAGSMNVYKYMGSLVGYCMGTNNIENCVSEVAITGTISGDAAMGGFISYVRGGTTNIRGCVFKGKLLGSNSNSVGGFIGWTDSNSSGTSNFYDCVFAPSQVTVGTYNSCTFSRGSGTRVFNNCFYTQTLGTSQGSELQYIITAGSYVTVALGNNPVEYNLSGITGYNSSSGYGIEYNNTIYAVSGNSVKLNLSSTVTNPQYSASAGLLSGSSNPYTLTMPSSNTVIWATGDDVGIGEFSIGDDASTNSAYSLPVNMFYLSSITQQIFTADEIGTAGTIKSISFNCKEIGDSPNAKTVKVYMKHTDKETFSSTTDLVRMDTTDMVIASFTLLPTATGWVKMLLDKPFEYDGQSNLLICCCDHSNQYPGMDYKFQTTATSGYTSVTLYSQYDIDYDPTVPLLISYSYKDRYQYRNNLKMEFVLPVVPCLDPSDLTLEAVDETSATISWTSDGASFEYVYGPTGFTPDWSGTTYTTNNTSVQLTDLTSATNYDFYVRANCGVISYSEAAKLTFRTACGIITSFPWSEDFNGYSASTTDYFAPFIYPNDVLPDGWTFLNRSQTSDNYPQAFLSSYSDYAVSGNCLFFCSSRIRPLYAVLPEFGTDIAGLELSFTYRNEGTDSNNGTLYVGYMTDPNDASTFNTENATACPKTTSKTQMVVVFPNAPANSYIAFMYQGSNVSYYLAIDNIIVKEAVFVTANQIVNTVSDPATEMTWNEFASHWNNGDHFTNTTFTLMDDINVSTMVGTSDKPFTGTFNGNSRTITVNLTATAADFTAPFRIIKNATIQNLKVDGTINDGGYKFCAGFAGDCYGNNIFTNCESAVTINATKEGDGTHGGFIARNYGSTSSSNLCTTVFNGCAFTGRLLGANTTQGGGFCGWSEYNSPNYAKTIFNNCVFAPQEITMSTTNSAAFARRRNASYVNFNNCYFMQDFNDGTNNTAQGKQAYSITGVGDVNVAVSGTATEYNVSSINAYAMGVVYDGTIYLVENETLPLILSGAPGYEANHGTLVANGETFTLTMEAFDTQISSVSCPVPYNVAANDVAAHSAQVTWTGNSESYTLQYCEVISVPTDVYDTYGFEDGTQGWTTIDADGYGDAWSRCNENAHNGSYCMRAKYNNSHAHQDYLVSPQITLGGSLSFYAKKDSYYTDTFRVYLSTSGNTSASDFTIELTDGDVEPITAYKRYTYDLSDYTGMGYVAIVYTAPENQYYLYVDDITYTNHIDGEYGAWQTVNNAASPQTLSSLTSETTYQVKVSGTCDGVETDYSDVVEFTTLATCPAPTELAVIEGSITAHEATITWTENGEATTWIVEYADNVDFTDALTETVEDDATYSFDELDGETTYYVRVKVHCGEEDDSDYSDYSNVVNFTTPVACHAPTVLSVTEITTTTVKLRWTENGNATEWQICLNGDETNLITANSNPFILEEGLAAATTYTVKVRANCGGIDGESGWSNTVNFTTACEIITLPYTYGFEDVNGPACWTMTNCLSQTGINSSANHSGDYGFRFYYVENSQQCLISPEFESTTAQVAVSFYYKNYSSNYDETFHVGYSTTTNDVAAFTWGDEITADENDWVLYSDVFPAGTKYVALKHTSDDAFYLYVDDFSFQPVFTKTIVGVGEENWDGGKGGYYLIASPLADDVDPTTVSMITDSLGNTATTSTGTYDLYSFDQAQELEWQNYRTSNFNLENGQGYLYASKNGTTLTFTGAPGTNGEVNLVYDSNAEEFVGWNLVGNPFGVDATIPSDRDYYVMNSEGRGEIILGTDYTIPVMEGIFVIAEQNGESLTFSPISGTNGASDQPDYGKCRLVLNLTKDNSLLDRAMVRFGEGRQLPKFQLRKTSTKVYFPQEGKDYAVARSEAMGTMPVNFKAESNDTYTLSFTTEEVSFAYLHLIDNMTGIETDLLANPSYSFDARTTDYESRFKLVFATGNNANDDAFAFYSNGSFVINNEGNATLQVIDVNGRILKSESINGCTNLNINAAQGIYMLRLVNGDSVKTQKVVVR